MVVINPYEGQSLPDKRQGGLGALLQQLEAFKLNQLLGVPQAMKLFGGPGLRPGPDFIPGWNPPIDLFGNIDINIPRGTSPLPDTIFGQRAREYLAAKDAARSRLTGGQAAEVAERANALSFEPGALSGFYQDIANEELARRSAMREANKPAQTRRDLGGDLMSYLGGIDFAPGPMAGSYQDVAAEELARRTAMRESAAGQPAQARD